MRTALLVIDIQKDYFPGGRYPLVNPLEAAKNAYMLLQCFREHGGYHVHTQHISKHPDAKFFISGDRGKGCDGTATPPQLIGCSVWAARAHSRAIASSGRTAAVWHARSYPRAVMRALRRRHRCRDSSPAGTALRASDLGAWALSTASICRSRWIAESVDVTPSQRRFERRAQSEARRFYCWRTRSNPSVSLLRSRPSCETVEVPFAHSPGGGPHCAPR